MKEKTISAKAEFIQLIGCLHEHLIRLNKAIRANDLTGMEHESTIVQELMLKLLKRERRLSKNDKQALRRRHICMRQEALKLLEISRRVMDDALRAFLELIKAVEQTPPPEDCTHSIAFLHR